MSADKLAIVDRDGDKIIVREHRRGGLMLVCIGAQCVYLTPAEARRLAEYLIDWLDGVGRPDVTGAEVTTGLPETTDPASPYQVGTVQ